MHYIFGDIHGCLDRLESLFGQVKPRLGSDDVLVFLGDYIDRGRYSYEVVEFLLQLEKSWPRVFFIRGNHEAMLQEYLSGRDQGGNYLYNGGEATRRCYQGHMGSFEIPSSHADFFDRLIDYYEADDFIAVHAGLNPGVASLAAQSREDLVWIREEFYQSDTRWEKTVIFGHTPTHHIHGRWGKVYIDDARNIIGIDTGAVYGGMLTCLEWPSRDILQA
ncbi:MAG TPA: metallophosphoesterase family protein [Spirochaetota bacterium]|nr:metallophosphoesterase family protein [Spirochaetota bacterium]